MALYNYIRLNIRELEELDYALCSQKRKYMAEIDSCAKVDLAKEYIVGMDQLESIHTKVKKEITKISKGE